MDFAQTLSITFFLFSYTIAYSERRLRKLRTPEAIINIQADCPCVPLPPFSEPPTNPESTPPRASPTSPPPATKPESTLIPSQSPVKPEYTPQPSTQIPSQSPIKFESTPSPSTPQPAPPCSHEHPSPYPCQPSSPDADQHPPPHIPQLPPPCSHDLSHPDSHQSPPPHSSQPSPPNTHQPPPPHSPQLPPPFSHEHRPPYPFQPSPLDTHHPPPPHSPQLPPSGSHQFSPPHSHQSPPPHSSNPLPLDTHQPPPPHSPQLLPPFSLEPSPPHSPLLPGTHARQPPPPYSHEHPPPYPFQPSPADTQHRPPPHSPQLPPPGSHQLSPPHSHQSPPPHSSKPSTQDTHQPPPPHSPSLLPPFLLELSPPHLHQLPPPHSFQPPSPGSHQAPPPYSPQLSPPGSHEPSSPLSSQPSPSSSFKSPSPCSLNSDYRKPVVTLTQWRIEETNSSFLLEWWYPQSTPNVQILIEYTIDRNNFVFHCDDKQSRKVQVNDEKISPLTGQCRLRLPSTSQLGNYAVHFSVGNQVSYTIFPIEMRNQWMHNGKELLGDLSLFELVIPGTHKSAAYAALDGHPGLLKSIEIHHGVFHQHRSIETQLQDGIRYLDLQPARFSKGKSLEYVLMNGPHKLVALSVVVEQIKKFIENSQEIVIVSFRDFSQGFLHHSDHKVFINYLKKVFEKHVYPYQPITPKLNYIWQSNRRLILLYHDPIYKFGNFLWPGIPQIEKTFGISEGKSLNERRNRRQTLQAVIPRLLPKSQDLYSAVHDLSTAIFDWATGVGRSDVNIIAVDYYEAIGVVDLAIQLNKERAQEKACTKGDKRNINFPGRGKK